MPGDRGIGRDEQCNRRAHGRHRAIDCAAQLDEPVGLQLRQSQLDLLGFDTRESFCEALIDMSWQAIDALPRHPRAELLCERAQMIICAHVFPAIVV